MNTEVNFLKHRSHHLGGGLNFQHLSQEQDMVGDRSRQASQVQHPVAGQVPNG